MFAFLPSLFRSFVVEFIVLDILNTVLYFYRVFGCFCNNDHSFIHSSGSFF